MTDDPVLNIGDIEAKLEMMLRPLLTHEQHRWGYCPDCGASSAGSIPIHHKHSCWTAIRVNRLCEFVGIQGMFMAEPTLTQEEQRMRIHQ